MLTNMSMRQPIQLDANKGGDLMPAHSFGPEWIDPLLRSGKQGTTRPQHDRIKVGDTVSIYIKQRQPTISKPLRICTEDGKWNIRELMKTRPHYPQLFYNSEGQKIYPHLLDWGAKRVRYYAHFLGKVEITEVYDIRPIEMSDEELEAWAWADGFKDFWEADEWFLSKYPGHWMQRTWTVERWHGWVERYFEPEAI